MAQTFVGGRRNMDIKRVFVIIPAAGLGTRMNTDTNKQFLEVAGMTVIERTLRAFKEFTDTLDKSGVTLMAVVVANKDGVYKINGICRYNKFDFVKNVVEGGDSRTESVWRGIEALSDLPFPPGDNDIVLIHDGARCLVDQDTLMNCLEGGLSYDVCAAAVPVKSTIKQTYGVQEEIKEEPAAETKQESQAPTRPGASVENSRFSFSFSDYLKRKEPAKADFTAKSAEENVPPVARRSSFADHVIEPEPINSPFKPLKQNAPSSSANERPAFRPAARAESAAPAAPTRPAGRPAANAAAPEVRSTPDRKELMEVQTPQVFRFNKLVNAYVNGIKKNIEATDDTSLAEAMNYKVHLVDGSYTNIKITTQEDIAYAEALLNQQQ